MTSLEKAAKLQDALKVFEIGISFCSVAKKAASWAAIVASDWRNRAMLPPPLNKDCSRATRS